MLNETRQAVRSLFKRPAFTAIVVLTLALGIGANATIFTLVNAFLIKPLPFRESERLMSVSDFQPPDAVTPASFPEFEDWRNSNQVFESLSAWFPRTMNLTGSERKLELANFAGAQTQENELDHSSYRTECAAMFGIF